MALRHERKHSYEICTFGILRSSQQNSLDVLHAIRKCGNTTEHIFLHVCLYPFSQKQMVPFLFVLFPV